MIHTECKLSNGNFTMHGTTVGNKCNGFFINIRPDVAKIISNQHNNYYLSILCVTQLKFLYLNA